MHDRLALFSTGQGPRSSLVAQRITPGATVDRDLALAQSDGVDAAIPNWFHDPVIGADATGDGVLLLIGDGGGGHQLAAATIMHLPATGHCPEVWSWSSPATIAPDVAYARVALAVFGGGDAVASYQASTGEVHLMMYR